MTNLLSQANSKENREAFLDRIAKKAGRPRHQVKAFTPLNDLPKQVLAGKSVVELLTIAKENAEEVNAKVVVKKRAELEDFLKDYAQEIGAKRLLLPGVKPAKWQEYQLDHWAKATGIEQTDCWSTELSRMENEQLANQADLAVGFADYLIANTGTITVVVSPEQGRGFNFLPEHYLALVPKSGLVASTRQAVTKYEQRLAAGNLKTSAINFISGPSNSGDIEMELVVGVHGPLDCTYLVVEDL